MLHFLKKKSKFLNQKKKNAFVPHGVQAAFVHKTSWTKRHNDRHQTGVAPAILSHWGRVHVTGTMFWYTAQRCSRTHVPYRTYLHDIEEFNLCRQEIHCNCRLAKIKGKVRMLQVAVDCTRMQCISRAAQVGKGDVYPPSFVRTFSCKHENETKHSE